MIMVTNRKFIRDHANKAVMESIQIELFIIICNLLRDELEKASRKDRTSS